MMLSIWSLVCSAPLLSLLFLTSDESKGVVQASSVSRNVWNSSSLGIDRNTLSEIEVTESSEEPPQYWLLAMSKGRELYQTWKSRQGMSLTDKASARIFGVWGGQLTQLPGALRPAQQALLEDLSVPSSTTEYVRYFIQWPRAPNTDWNGVQETDTEPPRVQRLVWFDCEINAGHGVFIVQDWERRAGRTPRWSDSDFLWFTWTRAETRFTTPLHGTQQAPKISELSFIIFDPLSDLDTQRLLYHAVTDPKRKVWKVMAPDNMDQQSPDADAFWALLGSPVGQMVQSMLTDHMGALKSRGIKSISATFARGWRRLPADDPGRHIVGLVFELSEANGCRK